MLGTQGEPESLTAERRGVTGNGDKHIISSFPNFSVISFSFFCPRKRTHKRPINYASIQIILFCCAYDEKML